MKKTDYNYIVILITYIILISVILLYIIELYKYISIPNCPIYKYLGFYCPACGSTRAVISLCEYHIIQSIKYNPTIIYTFILATVYLLIETFNKLLNKEIHVKWKIFIYVDLIICFINWILQNIILKIL